MTLQVASHKNTVFFSVPSYACHMSKPSHFSCFDLPSNTCWGIQIMKLLAMHFSSAFFEFLPLRPNQISSSFFVKTLPVIQTTAVYNAGSHVVITTCWAKPRHANFLGGNRVTWTRTLMDPHPPTLRKFLDIQRVHSACVANAAGYCGGWVSNRPRLFVFI